MSNTHHQALVDEIMRAVAAQARPLSIRVTDRSAAIERRRAPAPKVIETTSVATFAELARAIDEAFGLEPASTWVFRTAFRTADYLIAPETSSEAINDLLSPPDLELDVLKLGVPASYNADRDRQHVFDLELLDPAGDETSRDEWLELRVRLTHGHGRKLNPGAARHLLVPPGQSFETLAHHIDLAFGRWDLNHLFEFELDGRVVRDETDFDDDDTVAKLIDPSTAVNATLAVGDHCTYRFDFGDDWTHDVEVCAARKPDFGPDGVPPGPITTWGWGNIPDQYGRRFPNEGE